MAFDFATEAAKQAPELAEKQPNNTVDRAILDARHTYKVANDEREALSKVHGFDINYLDNLPDIYTEMRVAQDACTDAQDAKLEASHKPFREEADTIINAVVRGGKYVFRKDPVALKKLERIGDVKALDDRIGDLERVASFLKEYPALVEADTRIPADAVARAEFLADKLSGSTNSPAAIKALQRRNLTFWMLDEAVSEVRAAVRFAFPDRPKFVADVCRRFEAPTKREEGGTPVPPNEG